MDVSGRYAYHMALKRGIPQTPETPPDYFHSVALGPTRVYLDDLDLLVEALEDEPWNCRVTKKKAGPTTTWDNAVEDLPRASELELRAIEIEVEYAPGKHSAEPAVAVIKLARAAAAISTRDPAAEDLVDDVAKHIREQWEPIPAHRISRVWSLWAATAFVGAAVVSILFFGNADSYALLGGAATMWVLLLLRWWLDGPGIGAQVIRAKRDEAESKRFQTRLTLIDAGSAVVGALAGAVAGAAATYLMMRGK